MCYKRELHIYILFRTYIKYSFKLFTLLRECCFKNFSHSMMKSKLTNCRYIFRRGAQLIRDTSIARYAIARG